MPPGTVPASSRTAKQCSFAKPHLTVLERLLYRRWPRLEMDQKTTQPQQGSLIFPRSLVPDILQDIQGNCLVGHDSLYKTKERALQCYYWPSMDTDIATHLKSCHQCQMRKKCTTLVLDFVSSLSQPIEPNQQVHTDLFWPLKMSGNWKKFILHIMDTFKMYVQLVALPNKEATTMSVRLNLPLHSSCQPHD
jgi:hypothetical protein